MYYTWARLGKNDLAHDGYDMNSVSGLQNPSKLEKPYQYQICFGKMFENFILRSEKERYF